IGTAAGRLRWTLERRGRRDRRDRRGAETVALLYALAEVLGEYVDRLPMDYRDMPVSLAPAALVLEAVRRASTIVEVDLTLGAGGATAPPPIRIDVLALGCARTCERARRGGRTDVRAADRDAARLLRTSAWVRPHAC
ncbi:MAG: hypothetical protein M3P40_04315, partial [Actinomycetota bacterium]|nr:hypothetical protein [Actinomycetota bacterium]